MQLAELSTPTLHNLARHPLPPLSRVLMNVTLLLVTWDLRRRTRKDLRALSSHLLLDIGIDPMKAAIEAEKPFWAA
jgi:uncharacterized protein YjiS (DUF1127 family)